MVIQCKAQKIMHKESNQSFEETSITRDKIWINIQAFSIKAYTEKSSYHSKNVSYPLYKVFIKNYPLIKIKIYPSFIIIH